MSICTRVTIWWSHKVIADDPTPEYSFLDRLDGLG